jgi:hypothetical protein
MEDLFTSRPPERRHRETFPVLRSNKKQGLTHVVLCLSDRLVCAGTHHAGRTRICPGSDTCEHCANGYRPRWVGYFAGWHEAKRIKCLVEVTANAADRLAQEAEKRGSLRGYRIKLFRLNDRPNGELLVQGGHANLADDQVPQPFDVRQQLKLLWGIDATASKVPAAELVNQGVADEDVHQPPAGRRNTPSSSRLNGHHLNGHGVH